MIIVFIAIIVIAPGAKRISRIRIIITLIIDSIVIAASSPTTFSICSQNLFIPLLVGLVFFFTIPEMCSPALRCCVISFRGIAWLSRNKMLFARRACFPITSKKSR